MMSLPSASGALFSSFIVSLHTTQFKRPISGLLSSFNDILGALARDHSPFALSPIFVIRLSSAFAVPSAFPSMDCIQELALRRAGPASFQRERALADRRPATVISLTAVCLAAIVESKRLSLAALWTRCGHFAFAFTRNRERPSAIRRAWARALTAFTVRPRSAAMSMTEALEMMSSRSRSFSSEVQAFVLLGFFV
jgi:hypothetical protein